MTYGYINSFETFGTKDGPGIRFVYFLQGCSLRCLYCHNADTWHKGKTTKMNAEEAFHEIEKVRGFIRTGGVTVSGGEPLLQSKFVLELFRKCKANGIHTCVDTSGNVMNSTVKEVLKLTDLVLLDLKHIVPEKYRLLTGAELQPTKDFLHYLALIGKPVWIRYVLVNGYTDHEKDLHQWAAFVARFPNVQRVDVLPFHQMGAHKWENCGKEYILKNTPATTREEVQKAEAIFKQYLTTVAESST